MLVAGGDVYWAEGEHAMRAFVEQARVPTFVNGMGRGTLPADHELAFSRARSLALKQADLVLVAGTPLDFRLGFGRFGDAQVVHLCDAASQVAAHAELAASTAGDLAATFAALAEAGAPATSRDDWVALLRDDEQAKRAAEAPMLEADSAPIKPARIYGELRKRLDRDAIVIGDGGDFVSYAGKFVDSYEPGTFLDPGPYGCLGMGPGYALAAGIAHPDRQVVLLLGDGAIGFALGDFEALVRHGVNVVAIVGNNGIWGLEKHPMQALFGYDVVAELSPGIRYDQVVTRARRPRRARDRAGGDRPRPRSGLRDARRLAGERPHRPRRRLPQVQQPRLDAARVTGQRSPGQRSPVRRRTGGGASEVEGGGAGGVAGAAQGLGLGAHQQLAGGGDDPGEERLGGVHQRERRHDLATRCTARASSALSSRPPIVSSRATAPPTRSCSGP